MMLIIVTCFNSIQLRYCPLLKQHAHERKRITAEPSIYMRLLIYFVYMFSISLPTILVAVVLTIELLTPQIVSFVALIVTFLILYF
jgi:hypothetical protein